MSKSKPYLLVSFLQLLALAYPKWPGDFRWSQNGVPLCNCSCVNFVEPLDKSNSGNNYLCTQRRSLDPEIQWSHSGKNYIVLQCKGYFSFNAISRWTNWICISSSI